VSDLYFVRVQSIEGARVELRVSITHPDSEPFNDDTTFAHLLLADSLLELSEKKAAKAKLAKVVPLGVGRDAPAVVDAVVASVRVRDVERLPEDMSELESWSAARWRKRDLLPMATIDVTVKDVELLSHLTAGMTWESTAYTSEHVMPEGEAAASFEDEPEPEGEVPEEVQPIVLGKKNVFVITPRELYRFEWSKIEKKKKLDPKWADVPFAFYKSEKLMKIFEKANPEPPLSKPENKMMEKVQVALLDKLKRFDMDLVEGLEYVATHTKMSADEVRAFHASQGIENLALSEAALNLPLVE